MLRSQFFALALLSTWGCSDNQPVPGTADSGIPTLDAGTADSGDIDAGIANCDQTDPVSGLCLGEGLGAQALCGDGDFAIGHAWIAGAGSTQVIYVSPNGNGDGSSQDRATTTIPALSNGVDSAIVVLSKGTHDLALPQVGDLTVIGACPEQTRLSLGVRGPLSAGTGDSLRLWGMTLVNTADGDSGRAVVANEASSVTIHQTIFAQSHQAIAIDNVASVTLSNNTIEQTTDVALGVSGPLSSVIVGDNHFKGPIAGDYAIDVESGSEITFENNTIAEVNGAGFGAHGSLSSVIVGDNHFLGPLGGEGVFLGPLGGEGVFRVSGNDFEAVGGDALVVMESSLSGQISGNTFGAQVSGDGISLIGNQAGATITVSENNFTSIVGAGIVVGEGSASYQLSSNTINGSGDAGICVIDLMEPGAATLSNNQVTSAVGIGVELLRNSAEIMLVSNTVTGTSTGEIGPLGSDAAMAYGVALFDSKNIRLITNTVSNNATAGVVADMADWGAYALRADLSGNSQVTLRDNSLLNNGAEQSLNLVVQNLNQEAQLESDEDAQQPPTRDLLPTTRSARAFRCGNGRIDGAEECDTGAPGGTDECSANCRLVRGRSLSGGNRFFCATSSMGRVFCQGNNSSGQVRHSNQANDLPLQRRDDLPAGIVQASANGSMVCARTHLGEVLCWGGGQLGRGEEPSRRGDVQPVVLPDNDLISGVRDIAVGYNGACARTQSGELWCWGTMPLGNGTYPSQNPLTASQVTQGSASYLSDRNPVTDARELALGEDFGCYTNVEGAVRCWGDNDRNQLGFQAEQEGSCGQAQQRCINHAAPNGVTSATLLRAGKRHACALVGEGSVVCWGDNRSRQARPDIDRNLVTPSSVGGFSFATDLALGEAHTCVLTQAGRVSCWGANADGQLGRGNQSRVETNHADVINIQSTPLQRQSLIFSTFNSTCALSNSGALQCWGAMFVPTATMVTRLPR